MDGFTRDWNDRSAPETPVDTRRRDSLFLMAQLRIGADPVASEARIRNLSAGGLMAECPRKVAVATPVWLDLRGIGPVTGKVAWCAEGRLGIALDEPIDPRRARKPVGIGRKLSLVAKAPPRR